jgi:YD repeat-containing protein
MNNFFLVVISFILGYFCGATEAQAQTTYIYDAQGESLGTVHRSGNTQYFYDSQGDSQGIATRSGNNTYVYDAQGQSVGTVRNSGVQAPIFVYPATRPLTPVYDSLFGR